MKLHRVEERELGDEMCFDWFLNDKCCKNHDIHGHLTWYLPLPPTPIRLFMTRWATKALFTIAFQLWSASLSFVQDEFQNAGHRQVHQKTTKIAKDLQWTTFGIMVYTCWYIIRALAWFPPQIWTPFKKVGGSWNAGACLRHFQSSKPRRECPKTFGKQSDVGTFCGKTLKVKKFFLFKTCSAASSRFGCRYCFPILERCTLQVPNKVEVELSVEVHTELICS